jgi:hypothetical protein
MTSRYPLRSPNESPPRPDSRRSPGPVGPVSVSMPDPAVDLVGWATRSQAVLKSVGHTELNDAELGELTGLRGEIHRVLEEHRAATLDHDGRDDALDDDALDEAITAFLEVSESDDEARSWLLGEGS